MGEAQHPGPGSQRRVRRIRGDDSEDALIRDGESPEVPSQPTEQRIRRLVLVSSTQVETVPSTVPDSVDGHRHRRRRDPQGKVQILDLPAVAGGAIHHDLILLDSSEDRRSFYSLGQLKPLRNRSKTEEVWRHRTLNPTSYCVLAPGKAPEWLLLRNLSEGG